MLKYIIRTLTFFSLIISLVWCIVTSFDYEPLIVLIGSVISIIAIILTEKKQKLKNKKPDTPSISIKTQNQSGGIGNIQIGNDLNINK